MAEIREELLRIKNENHELEAELRGKCLPVVTVKDAC